VQIGLSILLAYVKSDLYHLSGQLAFYNCDENIKSLLIAVCREMPTFRTPVYSKINPNTGAHEACYTFGIDFQENENKLIFIANEESDISLTSLQKCVLDNVNIWNNLIMKFLEATSKLFSKSYTIQQINKITKHTLKGDLPSSYPVNIIVIPKQIQISGGIFWVHWEYTYETIVIDIPVSEDLENDIKEVSETSDIETIIHEIEEINIDEIPIKKNTTEELNDLQDPTKLYLKQRVKESRLKAKIAMYKAHYEMKRYYEKYGEELSDSESESEFDELSDNEEEEIQL